MKLTEFYMERQGRPESKVMLDLEKRLPSIPPGSIKSGMLEDDYVKTSDYDEFVDEQEEKHFFRDLLAKATLSVVLGADWTGVDLEEIDWEEIACSEMDLRVDDVPVDGATRDPISSNWAYDHDNDDDVHDATAINVSELSIATFDDVQDYINFFGDRTLLSGGGITDNGNGTATVAAGTAWAKATDSDTAVGKFFDFSADNSVALTDLLTNYVYLDYNNGTPQIVVSTSITTHGFKQDHIHIATIFRNGATLHYHEEDALGIGRINIADMRLLEMHDADRASGLVTTDATSLALNVSAGVIYEGLNRHTIAAQIPASWSTWYTSDSGSTWTEVTGQTTIDNAQYNDVTSGLEPLTSNRYAVHWLYVDIDGANLFIIYGRDDYTINGAEEAGVPASLPDIAVHYGVLIAKIIVQEGQTALEILYPWTTTFHSSKATDHGNLAGLGDDDHAQYIKDAEFTQDSGVLVGTGSGTFAEETGATLRTSLGLAIGTNVQAYDATLLSIAALGTAADKMAYTTNTDVWAEAAITAAGRSMVGAANAAAQLALMTTALKAELDLLDLSVQSVIAGELLVGTGSGTAAWQKTGVILSAPDISGTVSAASALTLPAHTSGTISIGANAIKTSATQLIQKDGAYIAIRNAADDDYMHLQCETIQVYGGGISFQQNAASISARNAANNYVELKARGASALEVIAGLVGAADGAYFALGGLWQFKFYNAGTAKFTGNLTMDGGNIVMAAAETVDGIDISALDTAVVKKALFDANTILAANSDDTPAALTVTEQTLVGRITSGNIAALSIVQVKTLLGAGAASGLATLNASTKVLEQPASITDHLDNAAGGTDAEVTKAPTSNVMYDHGANTTTAHGAVSAATASKHVVRDASARAKFAAPGASGDALIKGTRVTTAELPAMTDEKYWVGTGANVEERDVPAAADSGEGHIFILPDFYNSIVQGTWAWATTGNVLGGYWRNTTTADGDGLTFQLYLQAGTYTLRALMYEDTSHGIVDFRINGTEIASFDCYAAGASTVTKTQTSISVAASGLYTLTMILDGKHASSTDYNCYIHAIALWRTA